jgi:hypothetical protein
VLVRSAEGLGVAGMRAIRMIYLCVCCVLLPLGAHAQEIAIPVDIHLSLLAKVLAYDRTFLNQNEPEVVIGVVHECASAASIRVAKTVKRFVDENKLSIRGHPVRVVMMNLKSAADLESSLSQWHVDALYVAPLHSLLLQDLLAVSRPKQIRTITGVSEYVEAGVAMGIGEDDFRPVILVNLRASRAEGADLSAQVLQLAKVIP